MNRTTIDKAVLILVACLSLAGLIFGGSIIIGLGGTVGQPGAQPRVFGR